ncbi:hypothetical protein CA13_18170 [Planctomycetes bacterium CA13]|uniref:Uncharacterized protein n=1 Tax=Novipirellula herctigrandis TaxID=2527986 RepID=A0A5C5Z0R7_9BACT|nr:hypothetical protein CA13_18170 [Planctomycetes bacterium CA13]
MMNIERFLAAQTYAVAGASNRQHKADTNGDGVLSSAEAAASDFFLRKALTSRPLAVLYRH